MTELLAGLARRGVELRILHARLPSRAFCQGFDRHPELVRGGLELRQCPRVHFKAVVVDGSFLYLGSANWTGAAMGIRKPNRRNFELGLVSDDPVLLDQVQEHYQRIWSGELCGACQLSCEAPLNLEGPGG
jgi:phosphatidylserine/phosphatidylglycerophosphate/cardiolipin synthase-like enzyme